MRFARPQFYNIRLLALTHATSALLLFVACAQTPKTIQPLGCEVGPSVQLAKSNELRRLAEADQADRAKKFDETNWNEVNRRDLDRRIRVAKIFAEGCFAAAADFASAAVIYQHGTTAEHYLQAFLWADRALKLGDKTQAWLTAAALDRYLVKIGNKQLFGTQLSKTGTENWCLRQVEESFPESTRVQYVRFSVKEQIARALKGLGSSQSASDVKDCAPALRDSPRGTVPGFW